MITLFKRMNFFKFYDIISYLYDLEYLNSQDTRVFGTYSKKTRKINFKIYVITGNNVFQSFKLQLELT